MITTSQRAHLHDGIALLLFAIYGMQVCPFLDSLTPLQLFLPILLVFAGKSLARHYITRYIERRPLAEQVQVQFKTDLGLFLIAGAVLASYNSIVYSFPLESTGKVMIGMLVLGFFIACDLALYREYTIAEQLRASQQSLPLSASHFPISRKFTLFASAYAFAVVGVVFLVINKDLEWLIHTGDKIPLSTSQRYILTEIFFIVAAVMGYVLAIILGYSRNLKRFLSFQHEALSQVAEGSLDVHVPVASNDEFGHIAASTNATIAKLADRTQELHKTRDVSILGLATLAETRDNETGAHIIRTQHYVRALANQLKTEPAFAEQLTDEVIDLLYKSAPLHDVGKVGIPDAILLKPGKLTDDEFAIMKQHAQIGADALWKAEQQLGSNSFLRLAREISLTHHEKWDGSGYPQGLTGNDIPLPGRLMALADVYDALISKRVYKPAFSHDKAKSIILEGRGSHFDPAIVDAFLATEADFISIAKTYADTETTEEKTSAPLQPA